MADGLPEFLIGSGGGLSDQRLELREGHFDRVEVGAVWRQEEEPRTDVAHGFGRAGALVARQVVEDDHIAGTQGRHQLGLDIEVEHFPIHRSVYHPRGIEAVMAQGTDEGLGAPMPERRVIDQALPARGPASSLGHVGLERCFVNKCWSFQMPGHEGLAFADPDAAQLGHVLALLLKRLQVVRRGNAPLGPFLILLTLCDSPSLSSSRPTDERCTFTPCSAASSAVNSSIVRSGCAAIRRSTQPFTSVSLPRPGLP